MSKPAKPPVPDPAALYSPVLRHGLRETSRHIEAMHAAIASKSFGVLQQIPLVSHPAGWIEAAHNAISAGVYSAVRAGGDRLLAFAEALERRNTPDLPQHRPSAIRSALNGVFGDSLLESGSGLAYPMQLFAAGAPAALDAAACAAKGFAPHGRIAVFLHGLALDELSWQPRAGADFGARLEAELGYTPLYLRYNSGLPIADNCAELHRLLGTLLGAAAAIKEIVLIGHSMGGLIACGACREAEGESWQQRVRMVICLGSPLLGSPLERLGHVANQLLDSFDVTAPLGALAARRSAGIRDLRHGPGADHDADPAHIAWRFIGATLAEDSSSRFGQLFGDGLVTPDSATVSGGQGDVALARFGGLGHMELCRDERVYRQIRDWLGGGAGTRA